MLVSSAYSEPSQILSEYIGWIEDNFSPNRYARHSPGPSHLNWYVAQNERPNKKIGLSNLYNSYPALIFFLTHQDDPGSAVIFFLTHQDHPDSGGIAGGHQAAGGGAQGVEAGDGGGQWRSQDLREARTQN